MKSRSPKARWTTRKGNTGESTTGGAEELPALPSHHVSEESEAGGQQSPQHGFAQQGKYDDPFAEAIKEEPEGSSHQIGVGGGSSGGSSTDGDDEPQEPRLSLESEEEIIINEHFKEQEAVLAAQSEFINRDLAFKADLNQREVAFKSGSVKRAHESDKKKMVALKKLKRKRANEDKLLVTLLREIKGAMEKGSKNQADQTADLKTQIADLKKETKKQSADLKRETKKQIADLKKEIQQKAIRDNNMFLSLINQPVEVVPFLTPQPELPPIHNFDDLKRLSAEDAEAYCRAYDLAETGDLHEQRVRIARFINLLQFAQNFGIVGP